MKDVLYGEKLKEKMLFAVDLLCNTVCSTLGPLGNNVLISTSDSSPYISNDGVTIARNIESSDMFVNAILEILKESSLKTNELVGDGTTTTLVLLQSIFKQGLEEIENGVSAILLKKELSDSCNVVIDEVKKMVEVPTVDNLKAIATIAANDLKIGELVSEVFYKMGDKCFIRLKEGWGDSTYYLIKKGYNIELNNISSLYFRNDKEVFLDNPYILILKGYLSSLDSIADIINEILLKRESLVILVEDMDDSIKKEILMYYMTQQANIFIFLLPDYASHREKIEIDISTLSLGNIKNVDYEKAYFDDLGKVDYVKFNKDELVLESNNDRVLELIKKLRTDLECCHNGYEREFIEDRLSKLESGCATIYVGGITKTEIKEKLQRYEDALCALSMAKNGIIVGEGLSLLEISEKLSSYTVGDKIMKRALEVPFEKIMSNALKNVEEMKDKVKSNDYNIIYDFNKDCFESRSDTVIFDPLEVVITTIKNATNIASLLLTTNYLVINENIKNVVENSLFS